MAGKVNTPILEAALEYLSHGLSVIPTRKDKKPSISWKPYQDRRPTVDEATKWWTSYPAAGIGIILGTVSGGLWALDCDTDEAIEWLIKSDAPHTPRRCKTGRGLHAYFRSPEGVDVKNTQSVLAPNIDTKGEGGYVIAPPSIHAGGGRYEWIEAGPWEDVPEWVPPLTLFEQKQEATRPAATPVNGNLGLNLVGVRAFGDYPPAAQGQRNSKLAQYAGERFAQGNTEGQVLDWALNWNQHNLPPLPEKDVRRTVASIAKAHLRNHGSRPQAPALIEIPETPPEPMPQPDDEIPASILKPGGVIEMIMDYIEKSTVASFPLFSMAAALTLVGTLIGQKVMTETGLRTNLYIFALAPSGTGKNAPISAIKRLLTEADCYGSLGPGHLASDAALVSSLANRADLDNPAMMLLIDEIGDLIGSVKNKSNLSKNGLIHLLKEMHSSTDAIYTKDYANSEKNQTINYPHLSFYATGVPLRFWGNLSHDDITDGFLPRSLVFSVDIEIKKKRKISVGLPPTELIEAVKKLSQLKMVYAGDLQKTMIPSVIGKTPEAEAVFDQWDNHLITMQNKYRLDNSGRGAIYNRAAEHAHKIALIHAVSLAGGLPEKVGLVSTRFSIEFLNWCLNHMIGHINANLSHNEHDALCKRILALVDKKKCVTKREIYKGIHGGTPKMVEDAIKILEEAGELKPDSAKRKNGHTTLVWTRPKDEGPNA